MAKTMAGVLCGSGACLGIWLLSLSSLSGAELIVGFACSLVVGAVAFAALRALDVRVGPTAPALRPLLWLPIVIVSDAAQVLLLPLRPHVMVGRFKAISISGARTSAEVVTRRAIATLGTTATPGSIVLDVDEKGKMTVHALPTSGPHMEEKFTKS